jgi:hypothetical protein
MVSVKPPTTWALKYHRQVADFLLLPPESCDLFFCPVAFGLARHFLRANGG